MAKPSTTGGSTILSLSAENVKRLSVVKVDTNGSPVIVIAGENESGKSSVLDAIAMALGGKDLICAKPIREGQTRAEVRLDLGEYIVTRIFTPTGGSLVVTNREGLKFPSPQALLDGLVGSLTFDPLAFAEMDEKEQDATLRQLAGVDTTDIDTKRKTTFDERTLLNRDITTLQGAFAKAVHHETVGLEEVDASAIAKQLDNADALGAYAMKLATDASASEHKREAAAAKHRAAEDTIDRLRRELESAESVEMEASEALNDAIAKADADKAAAFKAAADVPDRSVLRLRMTELAETNRKVRDNQARAKLEQDIIEKKRNAAALTASLLTLDEQKALMLAEASFPVDGLGLDENGGVTWNGLPFSQASTAIRIRASVAIGIALNPKLKVLLVRNGNDLGNKNLALLAEMATAAGAQLWIERIAGADGQTTVVIEDGTVATTRQAVRQ